MARRNALAAGTLIGALVLVALHLWRGIEYWNYSEGVYAYTSRLFAARRRPVRAHRRRAAAVAVHLRRGRAGDPRLADVPAPGRRPRAARGGRAGRDRRLAADGEPVGDRVAPALTPADAVGAARARRADAGAAGAAGAARRGAARRAAEDRGLRRRAGRRRAVHQVAVRARADRASCCSRRRRRRPPLAPRSHSRRRRCCSPRSSASGSGTTACSRRCPPAGAGWTSSRASGARRSGA